MKKVAVLLLVGLLHVGVTSAAKIEKLVLQSKMGRGVELVVVEPDAAAVQRCATLYLLHGYGGDQNYWLSIADLATYSDLYNIYIVCPNGNNSWYWDSPIDSMMQYETLIGEELPAYIDESYNTISSRTGRAITGLSMGGHGAMWNAIRHSAIFGAAGSMSGGLDIRPFPNNWSMKELIGEYDTNDDSRWFNYSVASLLKDLQPQELSIIIDCGVDDFFVEVNRNTHAALIEAGIAHDYIEREGEHNAAYWQNSLPYQLLFFHRYFESAQ